LLILQQIVTTLLIVKQKNLPLWRG